MIWNQSLIDMTKNCMIKAYLPDAQPLINLCYCFGFVSYMLWNAAESRLRLCQTMLINQVASTAFPE